MWFASLKLPSWGLAPSKTFDLSIGNCAASKVRLEPQCPNVSKQSGEAASTQKKRGCGQCRCRGQFGRDFEFATRAATRAAQCSNHCGGAGAWHPGDCCAGGLREHHHGRSEAEVM